MNGQRGGQWRDHRQVINGILWRLRAGAPWRDVPARYGPWQTCYDRFVRWRRDGTWDRLLALAQTAADTAGDITWTICVDGTVVRAHQHAAGGRHQPSAADRAAKIQHPSDEALGRSRGGFTTKLHLACDGLGRPLAVVVTPGQRHESTQLGAVLDAIRVPRPGGRGRPRKRPDHVIADKGYSYPACRALLRRRGIPHTIPERGDQRRRRATRPGRPLRFDATRYRGRNVAERCVNALKQWRGIATRYEKRAVNYHAAVVIAALVRWLASHQRRECALPARLLAPGADGTMPPPCASPPCAKHRLLRARSPLHQRIGCCGRPGAPRTAAKPGGRVHGSRPAIPILPRSLARRG